MSRHNYTKYAGKANDDGTVFMNEASSYDAPVTPEIKPVEETVETISLSETVVGTVINCTKLNVRAEPDSKSDVLCVLDVKSEIKIDVGESTNDWFRICTATGVDGYCMRKYVNAHL